MPTNATTPDPAIATPYTGSGVVAKSRWSNRSPEQIAADRSDASKYVRKGRPLPEGMAFFEVVQGTWPGDESDEQIEGLLEELS